MPKKTKKEKLIAQYRKKLQQLESTPIQPIASSNYILPKDVPKRDVIPTALALDKNEFLAIQKDLVKTLIVICLFFGVELVIWKFT